MNNKINSTKNVMVVCKALLARKEEEGVAKILMPVDDAPDYITAETKKADDYGVCIPVSTAGVTKFSIQGICSQNPSSRM